MKCMGALFLIAGILTCLSSQPSAQEINLQGKVLDEFGMPVSGALLTLKSLGISCLTDDNGSYKFDKSVSAVIGHENKSVGYIGITPKFLELGDYYNATITVFSIRGSVISKLVVTNQNRVAISKLIPPHVNSGALVISIATIDRTINIKAVRCGSQWLYNDHIVETSSVRSLVKQGATSVLDTIDVTKAGMVTKSVPVTSLIATLADIILYYTSTVSDSSQMIGSVHFSAPSQTFKTSLAVTMTTEIEGAEIRYTTDGTLPSASSKVYSSELTISSTTQLRAAAFVNGTMSGTPSTSIYLARNFDYSSEIPIIVMEGFGLGKPQDKYNFVDLGFMAFEPVNGTASINSSPVISTRAGYHLRGQSSLTMFKQAPYRIELWDNYNNSADYPMLGMPPDEDWALISPCTDNTLIRNVLAFELGKAIGLATVQYRFVEVFINQDGGPLEKADYEGIYTLIQPIKNKKTTLNLKQLEQDVTDESKLSGGYIFKFEWAVEDTDMVLIECTGAKKIGSSSGASRDPAATCWDNLELVDPKHPNQQQMSWITNHLQTFHNTLQTQPVGNWSSYIDIKSFVNNLLLNEITSNYDAWIRSNYMYKDRNGLITAGPVWDYNFSLNNFGTELTKLMIDNPRAGSNDWHIKMWAQPEFKSAVKARWNELRPTILSNSSVLQSIDNIKNPISNVAQRNFEAWPMGKCSSMGGFGGTTTVIDTTWTGQITALKTWIEKRLNNLDGLMSKLP